MTVEGGIGVAGSTLAAVYSVAAEAGPAALAVTAAELGAPRLTWANPAAVDLLGFGLDEVLGRPLRAARYQPDGEAEDWVNVVIRTIAQAAEQPLGEWQSAVVDTPDPLLASVQLKVVAAGIDSFLVWIRPTADAVRVAEEAARESEHRFRALAEHAPVGIVHSEAGVRLGYVNTKFAEIAGVARESLLGTRWLTSIYPEDLPGLLEMLDEVLAGSPVEATVRIVSVADSQRWVQFRLSPVSTPRRSAGFIGTVEDITARRAWETQLAYQARHDALTGLANRRHLVDALSQLLSSRRSRDRDAAVLFCDLDGFKQINDNFGHDAGDRVLIEVAQRLSATARDHDLVARIAGDEFVVMIREIGSVADAEAAAARQLEALIPPVRVGGQMVRISASIGLAMARDYDSATGLLQAADRGMYEAKRAGRGLFRGSSTILGSSEFPG
ncbi:MAG: sensor diguanylate cyclase [Frankiales bacterium]|nr:sensor diguanylate cyclase [Frankiales bacterium]